jgi:hypothetical protein
MKYKLKQYSLNFNYGWQKEPDKVLSGAQPMKSHKNILEFRQ